MTPGIYDLTLQEYLRDPAPQPSLTGSLAHTLIERSPAHAWHRYQNRAQEYRRDAALGSVFHALFLGEGAEYAVFDPEDYPGKKGGAPTGFTNDAIRDARDAALANGQTPILRKDYDIACEMLESVCWQLDQHEIGNPTNRPGKAEQTVVWREHEVWCRACVDWLPDDLTVEPVIYNVKTSTTAHPDTWMRRALDNGYDLSAAHYLRGIYQLGFYGEIIERFIVVETEPPHLLSVIEMPVAAMHIAERKREHAVRLWGQCLEREIWPGYSTRVRQPSLPAFKAAQFEERELAGDYSPFEDAA